SPGARDHGAGPPLQLYLTSNRRKEGSTDSEKSSREEAPGCRSDSNFDPGPRIQIVTQGVANKIEREDGEHHGQGRKQHKMGSVEQMSAAVIEHGAPTRRWGRNS